MIVDIEAGGRRFRLSIRRSQTQANLGLVEVVIEDGAAGDGGVREVLTLGAHRSKTGGWTVVHGDGRVVDAAVAGVGRGRLLVQLPHVDVPVQVGPRGEDGERVSGAGNQQLSAPMPGRIVRLLVAEGDEVTVGQGLVIMEAMKMENALVAERAGRVQSIAAAEGDSVEAGRLLMTIA